MIPDLNDQLINFLSRHTLGQRHTDQFLHPFDRCWCAGRIPPLPRWVLGRRVPRLPQVLQNGQIAVQVEAPIAQS
jgi:hypothetical protein